MAAGMLAEKLSATIPPLGKDGSVTKFTTLEGIYNSFQQEVAIQSGFGFDVKRKVVE